MFEGISGLKKAPNIFTLKSLFEMANSCQAEVQKGRWVPARPLGYYSLRHRLYCAWLVFTGKCDVVKWPGGQ
jgi:hypothetical protein